MKYLRTGAVLLIVVAGASVMAVGFAGDDELYDGLEQHSDSSREAELFYREHADEREPLNIPHRFELTVDDERMVICETDSKGYMEHSEEITTLLDSGEWNKLDPYCALSDEAQEVVERGEVELILESVRNPSDS